MCMARSRAEPITPPSSSPTWTPPPNGATTDSKPAANSSPPTHGYHQQYGGGVRVTPPRRWRGDARWLTLVLPPSRTGCRSTSPPTGPPPWRRSSWPRCRCSRGRTTGVVVAALAVGAGEDIANAATKASTAQPATAPNHLGRCASRSCRSSPVPATCPSGHSSTAGTSSSSHGPRRGRSGLLSRPVRARRFGPATGLGPRASVRRGVRRRAARPAAACRAARGPPRSRTGSRSR